MLQALNVTEQQDFYRGLRDIFLHFPLTDQFRYDVVFNEDGTEIISSRYLIQTKHIMDANMEKEMLISLREIADSFPFPVTIYHHYFIFFDQFVLVRTISIQTITVAAIVMMVISLIFIPSPSCAIWVAFSIISIEIGVIGYMTLWNVNLDSISMINLIMCIGFSVDFSAHISYAYYSCDERTPRDRVRSALTSLGMPIFQGSVSTVLGIIALAFAPSYVFVTFFKTVFLVMLFGATHGVLLLPVLLSLTDICRSEPKTSEEVLTAESPDRKHLPHHQPHFKSANLAVVHKDSPFFTTDKYFNGKAIVHKTGGPIYIPRPSFIGYEIAADNNPHLVKLSGRNNSKGAVVDDVSVEGSKSLSVSDGSVAAEKDLGLGTSAEECSESSWKGGEKNNDETIIQKQPGSHLKSNKLSGAVAAAAAAAAAAAGQSVEQWNEQQLNPHVNGGYVSDSADADVDGDGEFRKPYMGVGMSRSKSSDIAESRRVHRHNKSGGGGGHWANGKPLPTSYQQQARLGAYHDAARSNFGAPSSFSGHLEQRHHPSRSSAGGNSRHRPVQHRQSAGNGGNQMMHRSSASRYPENTLTADEMQHIRSGGGALQPSYFDYDSYWDSETSAVRGGGGGGHHYR